MIRMFRVLSAAVAFGLASVGHAHHSAQAQYLTDQTITLKGVVTEYKLANPHARISFDVIDKDGRTESWTAEGESAVVLRRKGWNGSELKVGDSITITGHPSRSGKPTMEWMSVIRADGSELLGDNGGREERKRFYEKVDRQRRSESSKK